ncbi:hypothetical protein RD792_017520 [Penstemon davidsonii]|uniref:Bet v I/Major latex protein domain-containing protein n=1 Tax=Penstemon davidsonii TaxID=160366 RepID=A0ABR0CMJ0_9LAMI|nr:hypothetical protein RD792_017520 [Penstemon davidsonii]
MGVKSFFHEIKTKVSPSRLFKAMITESHEVGPKFMSQYVKSIETVEGHGVTPGCVIKTNFHDGAPFKYMKHRIDVVDPKNYVCKYTLIEGDVLGDKFEKICYDLKFEGTADGGCVIKVAIDYHTKGDLELDDDEIKKGKDETIGLYKACEDYLTANPNVCV